MSPLAFRSISLYSVFKENEITPIHRRKGKRYIFIDASPIIRFKIFTGLVDVSKMQFIITDLNNSEYLKNPYQFQILLLSLSPIMVEQSIDDNVIYQDQHVILFPYNQW